MKLGFINWTELGMPSYDTYDIIPMDDGYELRGENVSHHPWKDRSYRSNHICFFSEAEMEALKRLSEKNKAADLKKQMTEKASKKTYESWLATVNGAEIRSEWENNGKKGVDILKVNATWKQIEDQWGNRIMGLPSKPVDNLQEWFNNQEICFE